MGVEPFLPYLLLAYKLTKYSNEDILHIINRTII